MADFTIFRNFFVIGPSSKHFFWQKWDPFLRIFGVKVTNLGGIHIPACFNMWVPPSPGRTAKMADSKISVQNQSPGLSRNGVWRLMFKGCGMGPWLVLVSPCFRENVVATCKIGSFLCSLDNLLQNNVIVLFLEIKFQNGAHLKKRLFLTYFSLFLVTRENVQKFLPHISHSHKYTYFFTLLTYEFIWYGFYLVWVLVLILIRAILKQLINNKMVGKI